MAHRRLPVCRRAACGMLQEGLLRDGVHPQAAFATLLGRRHRTDPRGAGLRLQRRHDAVDGRILRRRPERNHHLEGEPFGADDRSGGRLRPLRIRRGLRLAAAAPFAGDTDGRRRRPREPRLRLYAAEVGAEPAAPLRFGGLPHLEGGEILQGRQLELLQRILRPARLPRLLHPARGAEHGGRRGGAGPLGQGQRLRLRRRYDLVVHRLVCRRTGRHDHLEERSDAQAHDAGLPGLQAVGFGPLQDDRVEPDAHGGGRGRERPHVCLHREAGGPRGRRTDLRRALPPVAGRLDHAR